MHDSTNSIVYLFSPSRPIIEDSTGIKFAPFPTELVAKLPSHTVNTRNLWDQVDDFKWLRKEHSPNWEVLGKEGRLGGEVLEKIEERAGRSGDVRGVLEMVGIKGKEGEGGDEEEI